MNISLTLSKQLMQNGNFDFDEEYLDQELENILNHPAPAYTELSYWNSRYENTLKDGSFEWFLPFQQIKPMLSKYITSSGIALNVGCGNSEMSADLLSTSINKVISIDFSDVVITQMRAKYQSEKRLEWVTMNCEKMVRFQSKMFDYVFEKGTLDTLLCSETSVKVVESTLKEIARVMKPNGLFFSISYGIPSTRKQFFDSQTFTLVDTLPVEKAPLPAHYVYVMKINDKV